MDGRGREYRGLGGLLFVLGGGFVGALSGWRADTRRRQDQWIHLEDPALSQRSTGQIMRTATKMSKDVQNGRRGRLGDAKTCSLILFLVNIVLTLQRTASSKNNLDAKSGSNVQDVNKDEDGKIVSGLWKAVFGVI